ncbi:hypothetical protein [Phocaeicola sartorii]|jgi:hypothetical protein|uniref:hypothetical protein n=1 Tax=Phocaeicola sartorii TaxID=671267 RepID=UPI002431DDED|nr:hypothetical protein [Phocaeicola sartorii]
MKRIIFNFCFVRLLFLFSQPDRDTPETAGSLLKDRKNLTVDGLGGDVVFQGVTAGLKRELAGM